MKRIIDTPMIQYTQYNNDCPFDTAAGIFDWLDGMSEHDIKDVVRELVGSNCLNEKGMEVWRAMEVMVSGKAKNKGIPKNVLAFYKRYNKWAAKNRPKVINDNSKLIENK